MRRVVAVCSSLLFFGFILWVIYLANTGQSSVFFQWVRAVPYGDKLGHLGLFGVLTLLTNWALNFKSVSYGSFRLFAGTLTVSCFVLIEELSQAWLPHRTLDWQDLLADAIGIGLSHCVCVMLYRRQQKAR